MKVPSSVDTLTLQQTLNFKERVRAIEKEIDHNRLQAVKEIVHSTFKENIEVTAFLFQGMNPDVDLVTGNYKSILNIVTGIYFSGFVYVQTLGELTAEDFETQHYFFVLKSIMFQTDNLQTFTSYIYALDAICRYHYKRQTEDSNNE